MYSYSIIQWLFFFYFYCFAGWCIESAYVSVRTRKLTNRGFMRGPFLPLYGSGAIMMLVVSMPFQDNILMTYAAGCMGATVLEYVTGVIMETLFKVRYWDYSNVRFNFQGRICLGTSLSWGFLTILMTEFVHVPVEMLVLAIPDKTLVAATGIFSVFFFADFALCFKAAVDLRDILVRMEQAKEEMVRIQKRLDAIIALTNQEVGNRKAALADSVNTVKGELSRYFSNGDAGKKRSVCESAEPKLYDKPKLQEGMAVRIEDVKTSIEGKLDTIKTMILSKPSKTLENMREEVLELKTKYAVNLADRNRLGRLKDFFLRSLVRSNPTMTSVKFREALEELKQRTFKRRDDED